MTKKKTEPADLNPADVKIRVIPLTDLMPDDRNANMGSEYGAKLLDDSISQDGVGRGVLSDRDFRLIAGNKTVETAVDRGIKRAIVVDTTGEDIVVTRRVDVTLDSERGRRLALYDNRVQEKNLRWDVDVLEGLQKDGQDLKALWSEGDLQALRAIADATPFTPNTDPEVGRVNVTTEDVERKAQQLKDRYGQDREYIQVTCPHCGQDFFIDKAQAK